MSAATESSERDSTHCAPDSRSSSFQNGALVFSQSIRYSFLYFAQIKKGTHPDPGRGSSGEVQIKRIRQFRIANWQRCVDDKIYLLRVGCSGSQNNCH